MKKLFLVAIATVGFAFSGSAQDTKMKLGVDVGFPLGDMKDGTSVNFGINGAYLWNVGEGFDVGAGVSYNMYIAKEQDVMGFKIKGENASFLPIYGTANYAFTENIFAGVDLGYAIGLAPSGIGSGVYYQPKLGYQMDKYEFFLGYKAISSKQDVNTGFGTVSTTAVYASINLGFNYKF